MDDFDQKYNKIIAVDDMPWGEPKYHAAEEVLEEADDFGHWFLMFFARMVLIEAGWVSGWCERIRPEFNVCLHYYYYDYTEHLEVYQENVARYFQWVVTLAFDDPETYDWDEVKVLHNEMAGFYERAEYSPRAVNGTWLEAMITCGQPAEAREYFDRWHSGAVDNPEGCEACDADLLVRYHQLQGDHDEALKAAEPILQGKLSCDQVPAQTHALVLNSLAQLERWEEADRHQQQGYPLVENSRAFATQVSIHLAYLTRRGRLEEAARMFERHLPWALAPVTTRKQLHFYLAARSLLKRMAEVKREWSLALPSDFPQYDAAGNYDVSRLAAWLDDQCRELGNLFTSRMPWDRYDLEIAAALGEASGCDDVPLGDAGSTAPMTPQRIRDQNLAYLHRHGFSPATSMPLPAEVGTTAEDVGYPGGTLRPEREIADRLLCHCAAFAWVQAPLEFEQPIANFIAKNDLRSLMTESELEIVNSSKVDAMVEFSPRVGWRLENIWSLEWILGIAEEPSAITGQLSRETGNSLMALFLPHFTTTADSLLEQAKLQPVIEVIRMEDLFYLAHNAVRSGQIGQTNQLPSGFDPIAAGGAIHERRHSLTWSLAPGASWDEVDLST